jgi:hypothetical protein
MNLVKTLVLFVIFAILAAYVYFYEIQGGEERELVEQAAQKIISFNKDSVKIIEIRSVFNRFVFKRMEDTWRIKKPVETGADKATIDGLISSITNMKMERSFTIKDGEQKDYGLVGRSYLVIFQFNNGKRDSVRFGDDTPVGSNVFASKGDTVVYTVASSVKNSVTKNLFDWRDKSLTKVKQTDVNEFKLKNSNGSFHFVKEGNNWLIKKPRETRAENSTVDAVLRKFESGKAKSVISETTDKPGEFNLARPAYQIDFYLGEAKAHKNVTLSQLKDNISNVKDDSRPQVMTVDSLFIRDINKTFFQFRYKKISEYNNNAVDSIVVTQGDSTLYFTRDTSDTWYLGGESKIKGWKMNSLISTVKNITAKSFLVENVSAPKKYGLSRPDRKIEIYHRGEKIKSVHLSTHNGKKIAFSPGSKMVVEIEESSYNNLEVKVDDFIDTSVNSDEEIS